MRRVALITGVAGGIGRATATVFAHAGWRVIGVDRRPPRRLAGVARLVRGDVADATFVDELFRDVVAGEGRLDALVNNAAIQVCAPALETSLTQWDETMATNVRAAFSTAQHAHPFLRAARGAIVNVSSVHALATSVGLTAYAASKGALVALTRSLALEFAPDGIRVNAVLPGAVDTPMLRAGLARGGRRGSAAMRLRLLAQRHALARVGRPAEIGATILFLADRDRASFITGTALVTDGGAMARLSTE
jgi:NAD(P)-dependent dehydrogenase (short-subunit alcohol dehydrogenase family)